MPATSDPLTLPPTRLPASNSTTSAPALRACHAAAKPVIPAPTTAIRTLTQPPPRPKASVSSSYHNTKNAAPLTRPPTEPAPQHQPRTLSRRQHKTAAALTQPPLHSPSHRPSPHPSINLRHFHGAIAAHNALTAHDLHHVCQHRGIGVWQHTVTEIEHITRMPPTGSENRPCSIGGCL